MNYELNPSFRARPVYFGPSDRELLGWLHPSSVPSRVGVVICPAFGREAESSYRTLRILAESCAAAAIPSLRFDYSGTGDSADPLRGEPLFEDWLEDTKAAVQFLRASTGVESIVLVGLRLGAAVAAHSAGATDTVVGLVSIAATTSGHAYLRELRMLGQTGGHPPESLSEGSGTASLLESGGYAWTAATQASIQRMNVLQTMLPRSLAVLLMDRAELASSANWLGVLQQSGRDVTRVETSGYPDMMLDPHNSIVPMTTIEQIVRWISERFMCGSDDGEADATCADEASSRPPCSTLILGSSTVLERPTFVGESGASHFLFGIQSLPSAGTPARTLEGRRLLLLNAGAVHRVGPGRLYVELARRWASSGNRVLRIDLAGIGDSPHLDRRQENVVYDPDAIRQSVEAAKSLGAQGNASITAIGLCSGAYHALRAAIASTKVDHVIAINPLIYLIKEGEIVTGDMVAVASTVKRYRTNVWQLKSWMRVASGGVNVRAALSAVLRLRLERAKGKIRDLSRSIGMPWRYDLGWELQQLAARGARVDFIFSESDPGYELLKIDAGSALGELLERGAIRIHSIPNADHTFTRRAARNQLFELLDRLVDT